MNPEPTTFRLARLHEALHTAERVGNTFLASNLRVAIEEEEEQAAKLLDAPWLDCMDGFKYSESSDV